MNAREFGVQALEPRQMLAGDHASLSDFPNVNAGDDIVLNAATGEGTRTGIIEPLGAGITQQNDLFKFTMVQNPGKAAGAPDFVSIKAETVNDAGSALDSKVAVYTLGTNNQPVLVKQSSGDGVLTSGTPTDGWVGFIATPGVTYWVLVSTDVLSGTGSFGAYTLRIDGISTTFSVGPQFGEGTLETGTNITRPSQDLVYAVTTPDLAAFDSLATVTATNMDLSSLDSRIEVYSSAGVLLASDSEAGRLSDAFVTWKSRRNSEYFIRVRSDRFRAGTGATGAFYLRMDGAATTLVLDPVTRRAQISGGSAGTEFIDAGGSFTTLFRFTALGTGLTVMHADQGSPTEPVDTALHLFDENGVEIAFADDLLSRNAMIEAQLVIGRTYFAYVEDFDNLNYDRTNPPNQKATKGAPVVIALESNHTFDQNTGAAEDDLDDHATGLDLAHATQLKWSDPVQMPDWVKGGTLAGGAKLADRDNTVVAQGTGRIHAGGDTDLFMFTPQADMMGVYEGLPDPADPVGGVRDWYRGSNSERRRRPASRLMVLLSLDIGAPFYGNGNTIGFRVYDSKGNLLRTQTTNGVLGGLGSAVTCMFDPSALPAEVDPLTIPIPNAAGPTEPGKGIRVWGGQAYYLEIFGVQSFWRGRYNFQVFTDSAPAYVAATTERPDRVSTAIDLRNDSQLTTGLIPELGFSTGNTRYQGGIDGLFDRSGGFERIHLYGTGGRPGLPFDGTAAGTAGTVVLQESGTSAIERYDDTDVFFFVAPFTGTVEIRLNTTNLFDFFNEFITTTDPKQTPPPDPTVTINSFDTTNDDESGEGSETYNSQFDGALRVFRNDFQEIAYNNDNPSLPGEQGDTFIGTFGTRTFHRRDPRVAFKVEGGLRYFVQIESGQAANLAAWQGDRTTQVEWARAIGSYELLIHGTFTDTFGDDHDDSGANSTVLPIGIDSAHGDVNGQAFVTGAVEQAADIDVFTFVAAVRAPMTITLTRPSGALAGQLTLRNAAGGFINQVNADSNGRATMTFNVIPGDRYFVEVTGTSGTTGAYRLDASTAAYADDHADLSQINAGTLITQFDFLGRGDAAGRLETPGDTDVFRFVAFDASVYRVKVTSTQSSLDPLVEIYEASVDPAGNTILLRRAFNDDLSASDRNSEETFSVNPGRTSAQNSLTYPYYYIVVRGKNKDLDYGNYTLALTFNPTDDHADATEFSLATTIAISGATGAGSDDGRTENLTDTDLFKFTSPATGVASVTVLRPADSTALPKVSIIDFSSGTPIVIATGQASEDATGYVPADTGSFAVTRGAVFYILIENTNSRFGQYTVNVNTPAADDYPNEGEFSLATEIPLSAFTGDGAVGNGIVGDPSNPRLGPAGDTDLFKFRPVETGPFSILLTSYASVLGQFAPRLRVFDSTGTLLAGGDVSTNTPPTDGSPSQVTYSFSGGAAGATYYILVSAVPGLPPPADLTGEYRVFVDTFTSGGGGGDPGEIDFDNPTAFALNSRTGDGVAGDLINQPGDRDLFTFTLPAGANGPVFVQVVTPTGSILDASVTILNAPNESAVVATDSAGVPGATASTKFTGVGGQQYWVIVAGLGTGVGAYTLRVNTQPVKQYLYYPEGYASPSIREYVSLSNNNTYNVTYSLIAYYEDGGAPQVLVRDGVIRAGARDGVTTSDAANGTYRGLIRQFVPYALVIESSGPLGATLAHYDFNSTVGDSFVEKTSAEWTFARVERNPGSVNDYLLYYNPNDFSVRVTVTGYTASGQIQALEQIVAARQRFGVSINDVPTLPNGVFSVKLSAAPLNNSDLPNFIGIVASLSHYDVANTSGFGFIGDADGGANSGVIPSITNGDAVEGEIVFFNPTGSAAVINLLGKYVITDLPDVVRTISIPAFGSRVLRGTDLQIARNQPIGFRYDSNIPVSVTSSQRQNGEADATNASTTAGTTFFFGDAFINTALAGTFYFETLSFYNPTAVSTNATVKLLFTGVNDFITINVAIDARGYAQLKLHELPQIILDRPGLNFFSVQVDSAVPIVASMTHYDLFLGGGWTTSGVPLGLTNSLGAII